MSVSAAPSGDQSFNSNQSLAFLALTRASSACPHPHPARLSAEQ